MELIDIKDLEYYKNNKTTLEHLINNYYDLPVKETIKGAYILLDEIAKDIVCEMYNQILLNESKIKINGTNAFIFTRIEQLYRNYYKGV